MNDIDHSLEPTLLPYQAEYRAACLALFDENCPRYFAANERDDFQRFLSHHAEEYFVVLDKQTLCGAFGLLYLSSMARARLSWIMLASNYQARGLGTKMMHRAISLAQQQHARVLDIAASHLSAEFFSRFGAQEFKVIRDGWGPDMHRVDMVIDLTQAET